MPSVGLLPSQNGPLCPHSMPPVSIEHRREVDLQNRMYAATLPVQDPETSEYPPEVEAVVEAAQTDDRMRLYRDVDGPVIFGRSVISVEAFYWRCQVCGFVLPATRIPDTGG